MNVQLIKVMALILCILSLASCNIKNGAWNKLQSNKELNWMLGLGSPDLHIVWVSQPYSDKIEELRISDDVKSEASKIDLPSGSLLLNFCEEDNSYITAIDLSNNSQSVYHYEYETRVWKQMYSSANMLRQCKVLPNKNILLLENDSLVTVAGPYDVSMELFLKGVILDFFQLNEGEIFLLAESQIYKKNNNQWVSIRDFRKGENYNISNVFEVSTSVLYLEEDRRLYKWLLEEGLSKPEVVLSFETGNDFVDDIYQVDSKTTYIVTSIGLWEINENTCKRISLPARIRRLYSSVFDINGKDLYITTNDGLYVAKNLDFEYSNVAQDGLSICDL